MTLDQALEYMDGIFEQRLREFQTALLVDIPARGVDVDFDDDWDAELAKQRAEYEAFRARVRAVVLAALRER